MSLQQAGRQEPTNTRVRDRCNSRSHKPQIQMPQWGGNTWKGMTSELAVNTSVRNTGKKQGANTDRDSVPSSCRVLLSTCL